MSNLNTTLHHKQCGAALIVSMLMLLILTIIGVTSMRVSVMEERMTGNERNRAIAIQAAESALRDAETNIAALEYYEGFGQRPGELSDIENEPANLFDPAQWLDPEIAVEAPNSDRIASSGAPARIMTKLLNSDANSDGSLNTINYETNRVSPGVTNFRVTARGLGADTRAEAIIQTHVGARPR